MDQTEIDKEMKKYSNPVQQVDKNPIIDGISDDSEDEVINNTLAENTRHK